MATAPSIHSRYAVVRPLYPRPYLAFVSADIFQLALSTAAMLMAINRGQSRAFRHPRPSCTRDQNAARVRVYLGTNHAVTLWAVTLLDDGFFSLSQPAFSIYIPLPDTLIHPFLTSRRFLLCHF